jgi:hypothetical protein
MSYCTSGCRRSLCNALHVEYHWAVQLLRVLLQRWAVHLCAQAVAAWPHWQLAAWEQRSQPGRVQQAPPVLLPLLRVLAGAVPGLTTGRCATLMACWP